MTDETSERDFDHDDLGTTISMTSMTSRLDFAADFGDDLDHDGVDGETMDAVEEAQRAMAEARARLADVPA